jgi:hypothetical protein
MACRKAGLWGRHRTLNQPGPLGGSNAGSVLFVPGFPGLLDQFQGSSILFRPIFPRLFFLSLPNGHSRTFPPRMPSPGHPAQIGRSAMGVLRAGG